MDAPTVAPSALPDLPNQNQTGPRPADAQTGPAARPPDQPAATDRPGTPPLPSTACPDAAEPAFPLDPAPERFLPWLAVQYATSPELGDRAGYTSFDAFVPLRQWDNGLFFLNAEGFVNNFDQWGSNLGGGVRSFNRDAARILGANLYWDNRDTGPNTFNQLGLGVESLGRYVDFRANGYVPLGNVQPVNAVTYSDPSFFEHFILLGQHNFGQAALSGFDTEVGGSLPCLEQCGLRGYAGVYSYEGPNTPATVGAHVRFEERLTDDIDLNLTVNSDPLSHTTVIFGASIRFGGEGRRCCSSHGNVFSRLVDPVYRNDNITVVNQDVTTRVAATKPGGNDPILVDHAASYAAAGGDGSFEHPFQTLPQLQTGPPADIVFVWANSVFNRQGIVLQNGQRFLGEGPTYLLTASQGTFVLPRATNFTNLPVLQNAPGNAVTLANSNEVAGFVISGAAQNGIFGNGVTDFDIHDNVITGSGLNGIVLLNLGANGVIADNVVNNNGDMVSAVAGGPLFGEGIYLQGSDFTGVISGNTANGNGVLSGGVIEFFNRAGQNATFGQGIAVNVGTFTGSINSNTANGNGALGGFFDGIGVTSYGGTTTFGQGIAVNAAIFNGSINSNTANGNGTVGSPFEGSGVSTDGGTTTFGQGIAVNATTFNGSINGNTANGNGTFGSSYERIGVSIDRGTTTFGQGIAVNATTFNGSISGNTANGNGTFGNLSNSIGVSIDRGTTTFGQGIAVNATTFSGSISGNTTNGNGTFGSLSPSIGAFSSITGTTTFGQGIAVNATTFNGSINGNTANGNGSFGQVSDVTSFGVVTDGTTTFGQGLLVQAATGTATLANNTLMNNGELVPASGGGTNVRLSGTTLYGQGMLLQGSGSGSFFAFVQNNRFGNNFGTQNANNNGTRGSDLLAVYTGSGKMGVELEGNTTTNVFTVPPPFNYDLQNQNGGVFHLDNNQGTTGGNGSEGTSSGAPPVPGPAPF